MADRLKLEEDSEELDPEGSDDEDSDLEDGSGVESARELSAKGGRPTRPCCRFCCCPWRLCCGSCWCCCTFACSILVAGVVLLLSLDSLAGDLLLKQAQHWLGTGATVRAVSVDLGSASAWVSDFHIENPPGYREEFLSVEGIVVDLDFDRWSLLSTLRNFTFSRPILVKVSKVAVHGLHVTINQKVDGDSNYKEILGHVNEVLSGPDPNGTRNETGADEEPPGRFTVVVDRIYVTDSSATVRLHPLVEEVAGPVSYHVTSISERGVGKEEGGVPVGEVINVLMDDIFDHVIQGAPESVQNPLRKVKALSDFAHRQYTLGKTLLSAFPTLRPAYIPPGHKACGSVTCQANAPCCGHGICAPANGKCCGSLPCAGGSVCCKSLCLLPGTACVFNSSAYGFLGHFKKAWNNL